MAELWGRLKLSVDVDWLSLLCQNSTKPGEKCAPITSCSPKVLSNSTIILLWKGWFDLIKVIEWVREAVEEAIWTQLGPGGDCLSSFLGEKNAAHQYKNMQLKYLFSLFINIWRLKWSIPLISSSFYYLWHAKETEQTTAFCVCCWFSICAFFFVLFCFFGKKCQDIRINHWFNVLI